MSSWQKYKESFGTSQTTQKNNQGISSWQRYKNIATKEREDSDRERILENRIREAEKDAQKMQARRDEQDEIVLKIKEEREQELKAQKEARDQEMKQREQQYAEQLAELQKNISTSPTEQIKKINEYNNPENKLKQPRILTEISDEHIKNIQEGNFKKVDSFVPEIKYRSSPVAESISDFHENNTGAILKNLFLGSAKGLMNFAESGVSAIDRTYDDYDKMADQLINNTNKVREEKGFEPLPTAKENKKIILGDSYNKDLFGRDKEEQQKKWENKKSEIDEKIVSNIESTDSAVGRKLAELAPSIGQQLPGYVLPNGLGLTYFTGSAKGAYMEDAKARGMSEEDANAYSGIMALGEGFTDMIGAKITKGIGKNIAKGNPKNALKLFGLDIAENFIEEAVMEPISETTATLTGGKETANWDNIGKRMLNSGLDGALSSIIMAGTSAGVGKAVQLTNKVNNNQQVTQQEISEAVKETLESDKVKQEELKEIIKENTNEIIKQEISEIQEQKLPVATGENTYSNQLKQTATEEINNSNIPKSEKDMMLDVLNGMDAITDADLSAIRDTIEAIKETQQLDTKGQYKNDQARRQKYVKYKNDTNTYDDSAVNEVLDMMPKNRNGRRTVKQWLQTADEIGQRIANLSNEEIERIAYKSWFDIQPSKSITQYDNVAKKQVGFQKFTSDEWINAINKAVNEARANNQTQWNVENNQETVSELDEILNNKELPVQGYKYEPSDNPKINQLRQQASQYFNNSEEAHKFVGMLEKIIADKDIEIRLDANLKTADGRVANGSYSNGVITINPNSSRTGEFIAIHELTHAIGTKSMMNMVENYRKSNTEFNSAVESLLQNYNTTELTEEALSDVSAQLFGNQEFINNVANTNPGFFKKIYNEIKYLWHQFRGYKNQNQFIEDLYYKWTQAYNSNNKLNGETNYSIAGRNAIENIRNNSNLYSQAINNYNLAKNMAKQGENNTEIMKKTGWFKDDTGKLKFSFSDKDMSLKNISFKEDKVYTLEQVLNHDTLFMFYPELRHYTVEFKDLNKGKKQGEGRLNGSFSRKYKYIRLDINRANFKMNTEGTLIHEIQHAIQNIEGFTRGTSTKAGKRQYQRNLGEREARDTANRFFNEKYNGIDMSSVLPESATFNRNILDKMKDAVYNYFNKFSQGVSNEEVGKTNQENSKRNRPLVVDGINDTENSNKSSFSMDNKGRTLTKEQQEYFKDSKVRDENGNLLEVYHGTSADFNVFDISKSGGNTNNKGIWGNGHYFSNNPKAAKEYGNNTKTVYLNLTNPFNWNDIKTQEEMDNLAKKLGLPDNSLEFSKELKSMIPFYFNDDMAIIFSQKLQEQGYDGIIAHYPGSSNMEYVAFNSNQIKNVDNTNPTENSDIRYSQNNESWQQHLDKNFKATGTRTNMKDIGINVAPTAKNNVLSTGKYTKQQNKAEEQKQIAKIIDEPITKQNEKSRIWAIAKANIIDKGIVFEELSRKANNRELQGKWDYTLSSEARGQNAIGKARYERNSKTKTEKQISKSLEDIREEVGNKTHDFQQYMYHQLNIDRMTLEERFLGDTGINYERKNAIRNKPVFGESVTADISRKIVAEYEQKNPEFKKWAKDVYDFLDANKKELVDRGVISQELSDKLAELYPHYVPIKRVDAKGMAIKLPLDTNRTGVNVPLAKATGGSSDIQPLFQTIADRTMQTYRASARNNFGVELMNTLNSITETSNADIDTIIEEIGDADTELLKEGKNGNNPTFTVFKNGEKITFEITKDMYDALKPQSEWIKNLNNSKLSKGLNKVSNFRRGVLTEYNPVFFITNPIKDIQDVVINSQHPAKTFSKIPEAYAQIMQKGYWYNEYIQNGGEQNSYFKDGEFTSDKKVSKLKKAVTIPLETISKINNMLEMSPRLAEYIASREAGISIETSMLNASRVTTNFKAGGDITKTLNRNGVTFLNASVQGMQQQIRNIQEANAKGLKGYAVLATKYAIAGLPAVLLNGLIWRDDEDYEELQDYVKDNYYIIAKYGDGKFIRIPKGRVSATIQKTVSNAMEYVTEDKKLNIDNLGKDFWGNLKFAQDNLAPNNPLNNNVLSPIIQSITNTSWYGEDIVPSRLKDKPAEEQYDESIDSLSIAIGSKLGISPYKINYLLDQYGGGISDIALPMMTKQAENNMFADKFTTDSVMKNKHPGEFYDNLDELKEKANSAKATDEDIIKYKYISSISSSMSDLYQEKREIQNSNASDKTKKEKLRVVQEKINKTAKEALENNTNIKISGNTATVNDTQYYKSTNLSEGTMEWNKVTKEEKQKNKNISLKTYADYKDKIAKETIKQRKSGNITDDGRLKNKDKMQILINSNYSNNEKSEIYENYIKDNDDKKYEIIKSTYTTTDKLNINKYLQYKIAESNGEFKADRKDDGTVEGKSVYGSAKQKRKEYIENMGITYTQGIILYGLECSPSYNDKKQIVNYIKTMPNKTNKEKLDMLDRFEWVTIYKDGSIKY